MSDVKVVILLPPSKGKTSDVGQATLPYRETLTTPHPLAAARNAVLDAILAHHRALDAKAQLRLYGVAAEKRDATAVLTDRLADAPTRPARDRYHGVVYTNAGLDNRTEDRPDVNVLIVSALLGLADLDTPVPQYRIEFGARIPPIGVLARFWGEAAASYLQARLAGTMVLNLLPQEHRGILAGITATVPLCDVTFQTPAGRRANTARIKVAKGQLVQALRRDGPMSLDDLAERNPLWPVWTLEARDNIITAVCQV